MTNIIDIKNLSYSYGGGENILEDISFSIKKKELIAIVGHNGSGKSTLIKILLGFLKTQKGKVSIKGKLAYIPQKNNQDSNFPAKVKEIFDLECCDCELRSNVLISLGVEQFLEKQFKSLSGGQQQRVLIALSLLSNPDILILDEPTVGIDSKTQEEFYKILKKLNSERKLTILFVTHDTGMISNYFTKVICVDNKKIYINDAKNIHSTLNSIYGGNFHELEHNHEEQNNK